MEPYNLEKDIFYQNDVTIDINGNVLTIVENGVETLILMSKIISLEFFPKEHKIVLDLDGLGFTSYTIPVNPNIEHQYDVIKKEWLKIHNPAYC